MKHKYSIRHQRGNVQIFLDFNLNMCGHRLVDLCHQRNDIGKQFMGDISDRKLVIYISRIPRSWSLPCEFFDVCGVCLRPRSSETPSRDREAGAMWPYQTRRG